MGHPALLLQQVAPTDFVRKAVGPLDPFMLVYGDMPLLCVELSPGLDQDLEAGLTSTIEAGSSMQNIGFHTVVGGSQMVPEGAPRGFSPEALSLRLREHRHFVTPLTKRAQGTISLDRIGVGRARNKDVVLRHSSVSKFHGWFEVGAEGSVRVTDAESTNGTKVDGRRLPPKESTRVDYGAYVVFGSVRTFVCDPMVMWEAFHR